MIIPLTSTTLVQMRILSSIRRPAGSSASAKPACAMPSASKASVGGIEVAEAGARDADHRDRIGPEPDEQAERDEPADAPQKRPARRQPSLAPCKAELVDREPDESEVEKIHVGHVETQRRNVDRHRPGNKRPEGGEPPARPCLPRQRHDRGDHQVNRQEPHRNQCELRCHRNDAAIDPRQRAEHRDERPDQEQRQHRVDQPLEPAAVPACVTAALALRRRPRHAVRETADEEEERHHRNPRSATASTAICRAGVRPRPHHPSYRARRHEPMADDDREDRQRTEEIDIAIALGRSLPGHLPGPRPDAFANDASGFVQDIVPPRMETLSQCRAASTQAFALAREPCYRLWAMASTNDDLPPSEPVPGMIDTPFDSALSERYLVSCAVDDHRTFAARPARRTEARPPPPAMGDARDAARSFAGIQEVGARRRRRDRQVPPARRHRGVRRDGPPRAGLLAPLPARRRPGQFRQYRRR